MAGFVDAYRDLLYNLRGPTLANLLEVTIWMVAALVIGIARVPPPRTPPGRGAVTELAVTVDDVAKRFRIVHSRNRTLKATIFNGFRRTEYEEFWALDGVELRGARRARRSG